MSFPELVERKAVEEAVQQSNIKRAREVGSKKTRAELRIRQLGPGGERSIIGRCQGRARLRIGVTGTDTDRFSIEQRVVQVGGVSGNCS